MNTTKRDFLLQIYTLLLQSSRGGYNDTSLPLSALPVLLKSQFLTQQPLFFSHTFVQRMIATFTPSELHATWLIFRSKWSKKILLVGSLPLWILLENVAQDKNPCESSSYIFWPWIFGVILSFSLFILKILFLKCIWFYVKGSGLL